MLPALIIGVFNTALLIRVLCQKRRLIQKIQWRNYRKMAIQMFSISSLFFIFYLTPMTLYIAYSFGLPRRVAADYYETSLYLNYFIIVFLPFTSIISMSELLESSK